MKKIVFLLILFSCLLGTVFADDNTQVVSNSLDWHDVYSAGLYAALNDYEFNMVIEETQSFDIVQTLEVGDNNVIFVNPETNSFTANMKPLIETSGYTIIEEITSDDYIENNLEFARLADVNNYVLVDDIYGYNAISVVGYAKRTDSFVLFVNEDNIDEVEDLISDADEVLQYGPIAIEAKNELDQHITDVIDEKSKIANNLAILNKTHEIEPITELMMTDGTIIEPELIDGLRPAIFVGTSNVPDGVIDFINDKKVLVGVVIGPGVHDNAKFIKDRSNIQVYVKFAKGVNNQQKALDIMSVTEFETNISIVDISYDQGREEVVLRIRNEEDNFVFATFSLEVFENGEQIATLGDGEIDFVSGNEIITKVYNLTLEDPSAIYTADVLGLFGEDISSLDKRIELENQKLEFVEFPDESEITISGITYNKDTSRFEITIENLGESKVYVLAKILDFIKDSESINLASEEILIPSKSSSVLKIRATLSEADILDNPEVRVKVHYGSESERLTRIISGKYSFEIRDSLDLLIPIAVAMGVVLILMIMGLAFLGIRMRR